VYDIAEADGYVFISIEYVDGEAFRLAPGRSRDRGWNRGVRAGEPARGTKEGVMPNRVLSAGLLGAVVMFLAVFVVNGVFGFTARLELRPVPNETAVYALLKETIVEPGGYMVNPAVVPGQGFPENQPVFGVHYAGLGHEAAGRLELLRLVGLLVATTLAAWIVSMASARVPASYARRLGLFVLMGIWLAILSDLPRYGIGGHPWRSALMLAAFDVGLWALAGAVMAWRLRPVPAPAA
jgi:hypothetical protein